jgi:hypothetical protein
MCEKNNLKERDHLEDLGVGGRLKLWVVNVWIGFYWRRIGPIDVLA